jgi:hypothetical protein
MIAEEAVRAGFAHSTTFGSLLNTEAMICMWPVSP